MEPPLGVSGVLPEEIRSRAELITGLTLGWTDTQKTLNR